MKSNTIYSSLKKESTEICNRLMAKANIEYYANAMSEKQFSKKFIRQWNDGDFRFFSFGKVREILGFHFNGDWKRAAKYIVDCLNKDLVKESEIQLGKMILFILWHGTFQFNKLTDKEIQKRYPEFLPKLRGLVNDLFLNNSASYNGPFQFANGGPCGLEAQLNRVLKQCGIRWNTISVQMFSSNHRFAPELSRMIIDEPITPELYEKLRYDGNSFDFQKKMNESGIQFSGYSVISYPTYDGRGRPCTILFRRQDIEDKNCQKYVWTGIPPLTLTGKKISDPEVIHTSIRNQCWNCPENVDIEAARDSLGKNVVPLFDSLGFKLKKPHGERTWRLQPIPEFQLSCLLIYPTQTEKQFGDTI